MPEMTDAPLAAGMPAGPKKKWYHLTVVEWLVIALIIAVLCALLLPPVKSGGGGGARDRCKYKLKAIGLALHNYHDANGTFPPAYIADEQGRPLHSWRVLLLPYLDQAGLFEEYRFDEPWNGPHNKLLAERIAKVYHCFSDHPKDQPIDKKYTSYVAVVGPETAWPGSESITLKDVTDSRESTLLVVEVTNSDIQWMEPRDMSLEDALAGINNPARPGISSPHKHGAHCLRADGSVRFLIEKIPPETLRALLTRAGGETVGESDL